MTDGGALPPAGDYWVRPGSTQSKPRPRTVTVEPVLGIRIRVQLQSLRWRISWKRNSGSTVSFRKYSPGAIYVMSIHCRARFASYLSPQPTLIPFLTNSDDWSPHMASLYRGDWGARGSVSR